MSWSKVGSLLPAVLASLGGCARVNQIDEGSDAGPTGIEVAVEPQPGPVEGTAHFTVRFSAQMDEGQLLASSGRSETVVLAAEANLERAAAAIAHPRVTAEERKLFVPAEAQIASDVRSIELTPDQPLPPGTFYLLVSPRVRDGAGRHLAGNGARFAFQVAPPSRRATLISPKAGAEVPLNLAVLRVSSPGGRVALVGANGSPVAGPVEARGQVQLAMRLEAGKRYRLSLDGVADEEQSFTAAACSRDAPPALQGGAARLTVRDKSVVAQVVLDWPVRLEVAVDDGSGATVSGETFVSCSPPACGPQSFECEGSVRIDGLKPATDYSLRVTAYDDLGFTARAAPQSFSTVAPLPRLLISEVMANPPPPRGEGEYLEILNLGPGAAAAGSLALAGPDGVARPLLGAAPPIPLLLAPGARALAVGKSFEVARYPSMPPGTPVLRASTQRLLGRGLAHKAPPPIKLVLQGTVPVELADFPGGGPHCPEGASLQRDEKAPADAQATWTCGPVGGTPGKGPE
jgi:hypothetical protein